MARRSMCHRGKIGAIIVSPEQRVVATGYNGPPAGWGTPPDDCRSWCLRAQFGPSERTSASYEDCPTIHGEMNALMHSGRRDREGGTLYVTTHPCWMCAKAVANSGLATLVIVDPDAVAYQYRDPDGVEEFLERSGVTVIYYPPEP